MSEVGLALSDGVEAFTLKMDNPVNTLVDEFFRSVIDGAVALVVSSTFGATER